MFGGEVRSATVEAVDDVRAVAILAGDLKRLLNEHPEIAVKLLVGAGREAARGERPHRAPVLPEGLQPRRGRAGGAGRDRARAGRARARTGEPAEVVVRSTQADLAQLAGTSREAASRFLATLQRAGVLTMPPRADRRARPAGAAPVHLLTCERLAALLFYALLWGLVVETVDRLLGDPFEPLDVFTLAVQICLAIAAVAAVPAGLGLAGRALAPST